MSRLFSAYDMADLKQVLDSVLSSGELIMLSPQLCYSPSAYGKALEAAKALFAENSAVTLAQMRDALGTSRKFALAILEYFDRNYYTRKDGDARKILRGFPA